MKRSLGLVPQRLVSLLKRVGAGLSRVLAPRFVRRLFDEQVRRRLKTRRQKVLALASVAVVLLGVIGPVIVSQKHAAAWWNSTWTQRRKITFNNSASATNLVNFPVRVSINTSNIDYAKTKANGADLRFVDADDTTALSYEIESWNSGGTSEVWVKVPQIDASSTSDFIYMYYNNATATDAQSPSGVWDTNYKGVWHMNQTGNGSNSEYVDSTSNANGGQGGGGTTTAVPTRVTGQVGYGQSFDNTEDYINVPYASSLGITTDITISAWTKRVSSTGGSDLDPIMTKGDTNQTSNYEMSYCHIYNECATPHNNSLDMSSSSTTPGGVASNGQLTDTTSWHYVCATRSGSTVSFYIDGALDSTATLSGSFGNNTGYNLLIGADDLGTSFGYFNGLMDEVRLSNNARSADWTKAEYLTDNNSMNSFASEETYSAGGGGGGGSISGWYDSCYAYRKKITIDNSYTGNEALSNFPVRVSLTTGNFNYAHALSTGYDIRFVDSSNNSLAYDRDTWVSSGTSEFWVSVPTLAAGSNSGYIYMYYGCSTASDGANPTGVWDPIGYKGVWHLGESGNGSVGEFKDSTSNDNDGRGGGGTGSQVPVQSTGQIGKAQTFTRANKSYITVPASSSFNSITSNITMSIWIKKAATGVSQSAIWGNVNASSSTGYELYHCDTNCGAGAEHFDFYSDGTTPQGVDSTGTLNTAWHQIAVTRDASTNTLKTYIDGALDKTATSTGSFAGNGSYVLEFGADDLAVANFFFGGQLDEARLSNIARSPGWMKAEYLNGTNSLATFGSEESPPPDAPTLTPLTMSTSTTPTFQMVATDQTNPNYLRYKVDVCADAACNTIVRTVDQTASQTGWTGQDTQTGTAYLAGNGSAITPTWVQGNTVEFAPTPGAGTAALAYSSSVGANNLLVSVARWGLTPDSNPTGCSDTLGNTFTIVNTVKNSGGTTQGTSMCYAMNTHGAGADTITWTFDNSGTVYRAMEVGEYTGVASGTPLDVQSSNQGTASAGVTDSVTSGSATTTANYDLIVGAAIENGTAGTNSQGTGFTLRQTLPNAKIYWEDKIGASAGSYAATYTFGTGNVFNAHMAAFKAASNASTTASYTYQAPALTAGTQYWWRAYAIDPGGSNNWSSPSAISTFATAGPPQAPTLVSPSDGATGTTTLPDLRMTSLDVNGDDVQYKIELCSNSTCSSVLRTITQSSSQTGWIGQNSSSKTRYIADGSGQAIYQLQTPALTNNTQYWWRAYAIDPGGSNTYSAASAISSFTVTTNTGGERITGGTKITGGSQIGF